MLFKVILIVLGITGAMFIQAPFWANTKNFYSNQINAIIGGQNHTYAVPAYFLISTKSYQKPFYAAVGASNMKMENNSFFYFFIDLVNITSTTFSLKITNMVVTKSTSVTYYGFQVDSLISFRYLIVQSTFPNVYISMQLDVSTSKYSINVGSSQKFLFYLNSIASNSSIMLNSVDTVFVHALAFFQLSSNKPTSQLDNSFQITVSFRVVNLTTFQVALNANKYPIGLSFIGYFKINVFIYNKTNLESLLIKFDHQSLTFSGLALGTASTLQQSYTAPYTSTQINQIFFGLNGIQLSGYATVGFQLVIAATSSPINSYILTLKNLWDTSTIPRLDVVIFWPNELQCPPTYSYLDFSLSFCQTTIPSHYFQSSQAGVSSLKYINKCSPTCAECSTLATNCTSCYNSQNRILASNICEPMLGYYQNIGSPIALPCLYSCLSCSVLAANCTSCSATDFRTLSGSSCPPIQGYFDNGVLAAVPCSYTCLTCNVLAANCTSCSATDKRILIGSECQPMPGFFDSGSTVASKCSLDCLQCSIISTNCTKCSVGKFLTENSCRNCLNFSTSCLECNLTGCLTCQNGFILKNGVCFLCGDGQWSETAQLCDDGNTVNGDGCNSQCQVQTDYQCLLADKLANGSSFCKFTKQIEIKFQNIVKDSASNTAHLFLQIEPLTFTQWTEATILSLINPIQLVNSQTGEIIEISSNSIILNYNKNSGTNQIEFVINYGDNILEGSSLHYNINPFATNITALNSIRIKNSIYLNLQSQKSGVYFVGYDQSTYEFQKTIEKLSQILAFIALILAFTAFIVPAGKLIIIEALATVQIGFLSILQFAKVPQTYVGLRNLIFSNGFNDQNMFNSSAESMKQQNIYKLMGIQADAVSNYNISFLSFILAPALIGSIGLLVIKIMKSPSVQMQNKYKGNQTNNKKQQTQIQTNQFPSPKQLLLNQENTDNPKSLVDKFNQIKRIQNSNPQQRPTKKTRKQQVLILIRYIFERILYQNTFYGVFLTSYLSWFSIFHCFASFSSLSLIVLLPSLASTFVLTYYYLTSLNQKVTIQSIFQSQNQKQQKDRFSQKKSLEISTKFGQFNEMPLILIPNLGQNQPKIVHKLYIIFSFERILSSISIVFLSSIVNGSGLLVIGIYIIIFIVLIVVKIKFSNPEKSNLDKNAEVLNTEAAENIKETYKTLINPQIQSNKEKLNKWQESKSFIFKIFYNNYLLRQGINFATVLSIEATYFYANNTMKNLGQIKNLASNTMILKAVPILILGILMVNMLFNIITWVFQIKQEMVLTKALFILHNLFPNHFSDPQVKILKKSAKQIDKDQDEVKKMMKSFFQKSSMFNFKQSPFIGIKEKQISKDGILKIFAQASKRPEKFHNKLILKNDAINQIWGQI